MLKYSSKEIIDSSEKNLVHSAELIKLKFSGYLDDLKYDITHISKSPFLQKYLDSKSEEDLNLLLQEYLSLIASKPDFAQIRYIGIENSGKEIVRVERKNGKVYKSQKSELQEKGKRDYFMEAIQLPPDSMYISPIDLNKEYDTLSLPYAPTLRVAYPVFHHNVLEGIIVINTDLSKLFGSLRQIVDKSNSLRMVNADGYYLMHEKPGRTFGFEFEKPSTFQKEFGMMPGQLDRTEQGVFTSEGTLNVIEALPFPKKDYSLFVVVSAERRALLQSYFVWRRNSFFIILAMGVAFLLLAFFYMNKQTKELKEITDKMEAFPQTLKVSNLPINRSDEIGALAMSFNEMSTLILDNMESLKKAKTEAEVAVKEKAEFLENMSHEIRNPLQSILGLCNMLENNNPAPHQDNIINSLKFNTANLNILVNDILDYQRLLRGEIPLNNEWNALDDFLEELHGSNTYFAITKKISFKLEIDPALKSKEVFVDKPRLSQVINNLLVNAIKFTEEGGEVILRADQLKHTADNCTVRFSVFDKGIGISAEMMLKIKERYFTHHQKVAFSDSFGLGLNIVIQLLESFGADLKIESTEGKGSLFYFDISAAMQVSQKAKRAQEHTGRMAALSDARVLIVDDDVQILSLYRHLFGNLVKGLVIAKNIEAIPDDAGHPFQIIITDYRLGDKSIQHGFEKLQAISSPETLIYVVTAKSLNEEEAAGLSGIKAIVQKPIETDKLLTLIVNDLLAIKYGKPNTEQIKKDYDYEREKYNKALKLLIGEWTAISKKLQTAILHKDSAAFDDISHKMITSVRRLELKKFENLLETIEQDFAGKSSKALANCIEDAMQYYIRCIREEIG